MHMLFWAKLKVCRSGPCPRWVRYDSSNCYPDVAGMARSYEIITLNLMVVTESAGTLIDVCIDQPSREMERNYVDTYAYR